MENTNDRINQLYEKFTQLISKQNELSKQIEDLKVDIIKLKYPSKIEQPKPVLIPEAIAKETTQKETVEKTFSINSTKERIEITTPKIPKIKGNLEKFIGENLISKIGIVITIIGVVIGAKYSIENDLISPLTRIILGYIIGIALIGFGIKLKKNYLNYSAVLVGGAIAIMYLISYLAYSFYALIPQIPTFVLMVFFVIFSIIASINYNKQVIAHIGLIGAYAIPFLLSNDSGNVLFLFTYISIINAGILIVSFKKYWKMLQYSSFFFTWLIFFSWYFFEYQTEIYFDLALTFSTIFFMTFYTVILSYKGVKKEPFKLNQVLLLIINSFIYYGIGYSILNNHTKGIEFLGLFTLFNALIHFGVSSMLLKQKLADKNFLYLTIGLVLTFITITIPVQLKGNWVTLLWSGEAVLLFWIGRTKNINIYEKLAYPLILLSFMSLIQDWNVSHFYLMLPNEERVIPLFNITFLTSILCIGAFGFINFINKNNPSVLKLSNSTLKVFSFSIQTILLITVYFAFRLEISNYWQQLYQGSAITIDPNTDNYQSIIYNYDLLKIKTIWIINYTLFFLSILSVVNYKKLNNKSLGIINLLLNILLTILFLSIGLYVLSELRENYLSKSLAEYYEVGIINITLRYISFIFIFILFFTSYKFIYRKFMYKNFIIPFDFLLHISVLWILSSELINWMDLGGSLHVYKLGLSILWGLYALVLIILGIWKNKKHLRLGAISLFSVTLIKLFFYDISHMNTILKTVVFVTLGVLLLIISFLYNKYKNHITDEDKG